MAATQKFKTCLWFNGKAEEAMALYTSLFKDSRIGDINRGPDGRMIAGSFFLQGEEFMAINAGPEFTPTEAVSIFVDCADQAEVDHLWNALTADGGEESQCGWLKDKYGFSWQIIPRASDGAAVRPGFRAGAAGHRGDVADAQNRCREAARGGRREVG